MAQVAQRSCDQTPSGAETKNDDVIRELAGVRVRRRLTCGLAGHFHEDSTPQPRRDDPVDSNSDVHSDTEQRRGDDHRGDTGAQQNLPHLTRQQLRLQPGAAEDERELAHLR